jgi:hypothetical protein
MRTCNWISAVLELPDVRVKKTYTQSTREGTDATGADVYIEG